MIRSARVSRGPRWAAILAMAGTVLLGGCKDSGLPGVNTPVDQARQQEWRYRLYDSAAPLTDRTAAVFVMAGQPWVGGGPAEIIPERLLRPVGTTQGMQVYALVWDESPYTRLYLGDQDGRFRPLARGS